jgi:hypothetical protein
MEIPHNALTDGLRILNDAYVFKVNQAAEHDRWDLVKELTDAYFDEVQKMVAASAHQ